EMIGVVAGGEVRVRGGIPGRVIDAVDDAEQAVAATQEDALQAATVIGRLDLTGVGRADRRQHVGENEAGLEEVDVAVEFELVGIEQLPGKAEQRQVEVPKRAL